jgi:hypothetical protein
MFEQVIEKSTVFRGVIAAGGWHGYFLKGWSEPRRIKVRR